MKATRVTCPVCESTQLKEIFKLAQSSQEFLNFLKIEKFYSDFFWESYNNRLLKEFNFVICECQYCHLIFQSEILDEEGMDLLYNKWLDQNKLLTYYKNLGKSENDFLLLNFIKKLFNDSTKIKVLDFGAGYGNFCTVAKELGFDVFAYDLSNEKNDYIGNLDITIVNNLNEYNNFFHFIHLSSVLEHLSNPLRVLKILIESLANNGLINVSTPNCRTLKKIIKSGKLSSELFEQLSPHQHINAFNNKTLKLLLVKAGYRTICPFTFRGLYSSWLKFSIFKIKVIYSYFFRTNLFFRKDKWNKLIALKL